jgi:hypothetical protein
VLIPERQRALRELANQQGGYFTSRQAEALGFARNNHPRQVASGAWTREMHGIYRLHGVPTTNPVLAELHAWVLWTMGRKSPQPRGAIAYETALSVYDLSDLMIHRVHLWVPPDFRASVVPKGVVLHRHARVASDITGRDGLRVVRPMPTLLDLLREGRVSREHIERGLRDGLRSGEITRVELQQLPHLLPEAQLLRRWALESGV